MKINKPLFKKILTGILWIALVMGFCTLWAFSVVERKKLESTKINFKIDESENKFFVNANDLNQIIKAKGYDTLLHKKINNIGWMQLEQAFEANPWIANAEIFANRNGEIEIDVRQRCPLMRIINKNGVSFYVDEKGVPMTLSSKFTAREIIVSGKLASADFNYSHPEQGKRFDLVKLVRYINADDFLKAQIVQINVKENDELELYPLAGSHVIEFGDANEAQEKFERLKIFYKEGLNKVGWSKYKTIDVRFKNQIVAVRN